jgi:endonuclease G
MPQPEYAFDFKAAADASRRWTEAAADREQKLNAARERGPAAAETPVRLAKRATHLVRLASSPAATRGRSPELLREFMKSPGTVGQASTDVLEQIIGATRDFLSVEFLERGWAACRSVCRTVTRLSDGRVKYGTGFLVSPRLLVTNNHVLPDEMQAAATLAEFDFQVRNGVALPVHAFALDPTSFFLTDAALDFTVVGISPAARDGRQLSDFGFCPLQGQEGKILVTEPANIVQHPAGRAKEVVVRENKLLYMLPNFAQYCADTEPGSSGSPVFNDQWEVVALHHSGIPRTDPGGRFLKKDKQVWNQGDDPEDLDWVANEGIRVSVIVDFIRNAKLPDAMLPLRDELLLPPQQTVAHEMTLPSVPPDRTSPSRRTIDRQPVEPAAGSGGALSFTVPIQITLSLGAAAQSASMDTSLSQLVSSAFVEAIEPDPDYSDRPGYQPAFLGTSVPLPTLRDEKLGRPFEVAGAPASSPFEIKYYHYSVILNRDRKMAYVSAVNYSGQAPVVYKRDKGGDEWFEDPRAKGFQTNNALYKANPLDRGHLTRRADAAWGRNDNEAKKANDDTFHFTNCTPQHEIFNQGQKATHEGLMLWGNLEDYVQEQTKAVTRGKVSVFNGPVFRASDRPYRDVLLPKEFWKMIIYTGSTGQLRAAAFILSQDSLIRKLPLEDAVWTPYKPFQVKVTTLEQRTHLDFGGLKAADVLSGAPEALLEAQFGDTLPFDSLDRIVL